MLEKIKNWLLYDEPLFQKEIRSNHDKSIPKRLWKKNWLGLTKIYDSYEQQYNWCFIKITSHLTEDDYIEDYRNTLTIGWGPYYKKYLLPFSILKPILDYHHYEKDENGKDTDKIRWSTYVEREYKIMIAKEEGYFSIDLNHGDNFLYNITKHKGYHFWYWFFWKNTYRSKNELLNLDGTLFKDITYLDKGFFNFKEKEEIENLQPKIVFEILDYDQEPVTVVGNLERMTYKKGNGKFTRFLMSIFSKPEVYTKLDLEFKKEIGRGKGSYKGGTTGQAVKLLENESPEDAFSRYCYDPEVRGFRSTKFENLTFLSYKKYKNYGITDEIAYEEKDVDNNIRKVVIVLLNLEKDTFVEYDRDEDLQYLPLCYCIYNRELNIKDSGKKIYKIDIKDNESYYINKLISRIFNSVVVTETEGDDEIVSADILKSVKIKESIKSNGSLEYYFTEEVKNYLLEKMNMYFKYSDFVEVQGEEDAI